MMRPPFLADDNDDSDDTFPVRSLLNISDSIKT